MSAVKSPKAQHQDTDTISTRPKNTRNAASLRSPHQAAPSSVVLPSGRAPKRNPWFPERTLYPCGASASTLPNRPAQCSGGRRLAQRAPTRARRPRPTPEQARLRREAPIRCGRTQLCTRRRRRSAPVALHGRSRPICASANSVGVPRRSWPSMHRHRRLVGDRSLVGQPPSPLTGVRRGCVGGYCFRVLRALSGPHGPPDRGEGVPAGLCGGVRRLFVGNEVSASPTQSVAVVPRFALEIRHFGCPSMSGSRHEPPRRRARETGGSRCSTTLERHEGRVSLPRPWLGRCR
jgi:hypothetical protein